MENKRGASPLLLPKKRKASLAKRFSEVEHISISGIAEHMGPLGMHMYAESYLLAAQALPKPQAPFEPVRPYLICHSIELALKAYLSIQGVAMIRLAEGPYAHNLESLLAKANDAGLPKVAAFTDAQGNAIRLATTYYSGKVFEYPAVGEAFNAYPHMPPIEPLTEAASFLVEALRQPCHQAK